MAYTVLPPAARAVLKTKEQQAEKRSADKMEMSLGYSFLNPG
jgi:hypothetical protein